MISRRSFIQSASIAGGGVVFGLSLWTEGSGHAADTPSDSEIFAPNCWLRIYPDNRIVFILDRTEMGQGVMTSLAMIIAEELCVEPEQLTIEFAGADRVYNNPELNIQMTGGSSSVRAGFDPLRRAGATVCQLFVSTAATALKVNARECVAEGGRVFHKSSQRSLSFGELAESAARRPTPQDIYLKNPADYKIIGKERPRLDARAKVTGAATFGIDVLVPGMQVAVLIRCPYFGGSLKKVDTTSASASAGVTAVFPLSVRGEQNDAVAVVAKGYWQARRAAEKLQVEWTRGQLGTTNSAEIKKTAEALAQAKGNAKSCRKDGDPEEAWKSSVKKIEAIYEAPYLAHATMEPMNCTAHVTKDRCDIWAPTQAPGLVHEIVCQMTGLGREKVFVHQTFLGGGFGRRLVQDYVSEAVLVSQVIKGPVKIIWSREDDMRGDFYRPMTYQVLQGAVDDHGKLTVWRQKIVSPSILAQTVPSWLKALAPKWVPYAVSDGAGALAGKLFRGTMTDDTAVEGAVQLPYDCGHVGVEYVHFDPGVPVGFWRSVGHSQNAFVTESFIDELAHLVGADPLDFRMRLLPKDSRNRRVLEMAAEKINWSAKAPEGIFRGIAQHACFGSFAAHAVEVAISGESIRVTKVVTAVDCGFIINPDQVRAQIEGSILFGISAALYGEITFEDGKVAQSNFHEYPVARMMDTPEIEVHFIQGSDRPSGVGEPGVPPVAPAIANAVFRATGKRLRRLPLKLDNHA